MASEIKLPRLSQGMESGTVVRWLKGEGDRVEKGEPLYELDTDKVTQEVEAPAAGRLLRIVLPEGEAPVGTTIAFLGEEGEQVPEAATPPPPRAQAAPAEPEPLVYDDETAAPAEPAAEIKASPLARRLARERGVDLGDLTGTGPEGRIVAEDVERSAAPASAAIAPGAEARPAPAPAPAPARPQARPAIAPGSVERVPLTTARRTLARRLTEAWQAPAFQLSLQADMSEVQAMHGRLRERARPGEGHVSVADFLTKACAQALVRYPGLNALWTDDAVELHGSVDIGIATATERGLVVPVIRGCEQKTLAELAEARADVVARARAGTLALDDLEGGTFTISNLGPFGIEQFVAVLNPPQVAILAAGSIGEHPVALSGKVEILPLLSMTLTCDHRAVDGSVAAEFLQTVRDYLEEPGLML
jgi:pyruvate dehydrogenase E2 component (dihydrolipoamide acetyltransferase)